MLKAFILGLWLANAADAGSSLNAFRYGAVEQNPFVVSTRPVPFVSEVVAATALETWLATQLNKNHPKLTKTLLGVGIGIGAGVTVRNTHIANGLRRDKN